MACKKSVAALLVGCACKRSRQSLRGGTIDLETLVFARLIVAVDAG